MMPLLVLEWIANDFSLHSGVFTNLGLLHHLPIDFNTHLSESFLKYLLAILEEVKLLFRVFVCIEVDCQFECLWTGSLLPRMCVKLRDNSQKLSELG